MLKFADLLVDNKSEKSKIEFFSQKFLNSYFPLLMLYLGRVDSFTVKINVDEDDPYTIISITQDEIRDFFDQSDFDKSVDEVKRNLGLTDLATDIWNSIPMFHLLAYRDEKGVNNIGLCIKENTDHILFNILKILAIQEEDILKVGKVYTFLNLWEIGTIGAGLSNKGKEDSIHFEEWIKKFEDAIVKIQAYSRDRLWAQPEELTDIMLSLRDSKGPIFNPFAGLASFSVKSLKDDIGYYNTELALHDDYYGQEIDSITWAVGKLRLLAYNTNSENYVLSDSNKWIDKTFNYIFSTPPFGTKIKNEDGKMEYADSFVLRRSVDTMENGGLTACVVPASFLTRKDTYELRKLLVENRLIEKVVALPEGVFLPYTNIKTALIVLRNKRNNSVKFIDATRFYKVDGRERKLNRSFIKNLIQYNEYPEYEYRDTDKALLQVVKSEFLSSITNCRFDEIIEKDYILNVHTYIRHSSLSKEGYEDIYLGSIFFPIQKDREEIVKKTKPENYFQFGRCVDLNDLSSNPYHPYIDYSSLYYTEKAENFEAVQGPAILFSLQGDFRASLLKDDQIVFIPKGIIEAFGYDPKEYYGEYIVNELYKPYVKDEIEDFEIIDSRSGDDICLITILSPKADKYEWKRDVPTLQKEALILEKNERILALEEQISEMKDSSKGEYVKSLRQRKHRIQQVMNELCPAFSLLDKFRTERGKLNNDDIIGKRTGKTVNDYFVLIGNAIDKVESMITNIVDEDEWGESEIFKLKDFIYEFSQRNLSDRFVIKVNYNVNDGIGEDGILVSINRDKLAIVFENIIANARRWGFVNSKRIDYCVRIDVDKPSSNIVRIRVANNGEPIHPSLDRSRIFEWGIGNHTGYGTWQVKNIIEHYLGSVELKEYPEDEAGFQTEYEIVLPAYV